MPFFIRNKVTDRSKGKTGKKTKKGPSTPGHTGTVAGRQVSKSKLVGSEDEEIPSDIESEEESSKRKLPEYSSDEEEETAQEKRLRLAKQYLSQLEAKADDADEDVSEAVADQLKQDVLEQAGKLRKLVASRYCAPSPQDDVMVCRGRSHKLSLTCVVVTPDNQHVFTGSKDCSIIKWSLRDGKRVTVIPRTEKPNDDQAKSATGHSGHVLCLAVSSDNAILASGDVNKLIILWNPDTCQHLHTFTGHRDAIMGLAFRKGSHQMFSASKDRSVKIWNCDEMAYVETLFGHHDAITAIDSLSRERAVTSGGRDGSVRIWKVIEESQLVFNGHSGSIDCVSLIDEEHFVSGADDNSIAVWSVMKKKPLVTVTRPHQEEPRPDAISNHQQGENWISSIAALTHTDLIASGSKDGCVRLWQCSKDFKTLTPLFTIPVAGFINGMKFSSDGQYLVCAVGQEHRLGRWWSLKHAKNSLCIIRLHKTDDK